MRKHFLVLACLVLMVSSSAYCEMLPYRSEDNHWGYCDEYQHVLISPQWDSASYFRNGQTAIVGKLGTDGVMRYGLIDQSGNMVVDCEYQILSGESGTFFGGEDGFYGIWDINNQLSGFYDIRNGFFCPPKYASVYLNQTYDSHMIAVCDPETHRWGYVDVINDHQITDFMFYEVGPVCDGYAVAGTMEKQYIIASTGSMTEIDGDYYAPGWIAHSLLIVHGKDGDYLMNLQGEIVTGRYDAIELYGGQYYGSIDGQHVFVAVTLAAE